MLDILSRNNVKVSGRGQRPLLFAHGYGCDQAMWQMVGPAFAQDYKLVLLDYVGAGRSDLDAYEPERYSSLHGYARDITEVCEALDLQDAILIGHSVSSMICLLAAKAIPHRIAGLVMVCPSPRYLDDPPDYIGGFALADIEGLLDMIDRNQTGWAAYLAGVVAQNPDRPELASQLEASFCAMRPDIAKRFAKVTFLSDNRQDLADFEKPTLILQCAEDVVAPAVVGEFMHQHMPYSTLRYLMATGHCPQLSHPDETASVIRSYLSQQDFASVP